MQSFKSLFDVTITLLLFLALLIWLLARCHVFYVPLVIIFSIQFNEKCFLFTFSRFVRSRDKSHILKQVCKIALKACSDIWTAFIWVWINSVFRRNVHTLIIVRNYHSLLGGIIETCNFLQLISYQHLEHSVIKPAQYVCPPKHWTFSLVVFLPAIDSNSLCSFISSCAANYLPAPFPVFQQQPRPCTGEERGEKGGRERRLGRGGPLSSDIVIKESPAQGRARPLFFSY